MADGAFDRKRGAKAAAAAAPAVGSESHRALEARAANGPQPRAARVTRQPQPIQPTRPPNRTGLPDKLKAGLEVLSGLSLDAVRVHYGSSKPARFQAHAYARGNEIHVARGEERHLHHEAWHVVQQMQSRVPPTARVQGEALSDDRALEAEADKMGAQAAALGARASGWWQGSPESGTARFRDTTLLKSTPSPPRNTLQLRAKVIIDAEGMKVERDGDLKFLSDELKQIRMGDVYRHMSAKDTRLNAARHFLNQYKEDEVAVAASKWIVPLQNQLTGWEFYTEHLGKQFMGKAESNRKLTKGEYDSLILEAQKQGKNVTKELLDIELAALAENYMYIYLSKHGASEKDFIETVQGKSQLTLDSMWIFQSMEGEIRRTAGALGVSPDLVLATLRQRLTPQMAQEAMGQIAGAAHKAFVEKQWIGPVTQAGAPHGTYYTKESTKTAN